MGSLSLETLVNEDIIFSFKQFQNKLMKLRMGGTTLGLQDILSVTESFIIIIIVILIMIINNYNNTILVEWEGGKYNIGEVGGDGIGW